LPLTITCHLGDNKGTDMWVSDKIEDDDAFNDIEIYDGETLIKTYKVTQLEYCSNGVYLRWIYKGEYQYFYFQNGDNADELEDGVVFKNNVWGLDATNNVFASDLRLKNKSGNEIIECGVKTAPYEQQVHLIGLQRSIKQWMYENGNWIEVKVEMTPIVIDRLRLNKEINVRVVKPSLYIESL
jgi:hypothetical protein